MAVLVEQIHLRAERDAVGRLLQRIHDDGRGDARFEPADLARDGLACELVLQGVAALCRRAQLREALLLAREADRRRAVRMFAERNLRQRIGTVGIFDESAAHEIEVGPSGANSMPARRRRRSSVQGRIDGYVPRSQRLARGPRGFAIVAASSNEEFPWSPTCPRSSSCSTCCC